MTSELLEEYVMWHGRRKIELLNGQLIVGNSLSHSRLLFSQILRGWGAISAVSLAPESLWWEALTLVFGAPPVPNLDTIDADGLRNWASQVIFTPDIPQLTPCGSRKRINIRQVLYFAFFGLGRNGHQLGQSLGGGFVNRLGNNAFMPDILFYKGQGLNRLYEYYLDGPAELIVEFIIPGCENYDREVKRSYYQSAGVPEYWTVEIEQENIEFLRLVDGIYQAQQPSTDGRYEVSSIPGLTFLPAKLWEAEGLSKSLLGNDLFEVQSSALTVERIRTIGEGVDWSRGQLGFAPALEPVPVTFDDYIYWCPEAKFEFVDGKPYIGSREGIQGLTGMFLMTFGLVESVKLLHPRFWVEALLARRFAVQNNQEHKAQVWQLVNEAAKLLREQYGATRLGIIGDLVKPEPLNFWSEITLVAWDLPQEVAGESYLAISELSDSPKLHLLDAEDATPTQEQAIASELVEI
jgi:Putative restriction endonuclease